MSDRPAPLGNDPDSAQTRPGARRSHALESLTSYLRTSGGLQVLDLGGINQSNLDFLTGMGHRVYADNLLFAVDYFFSPQELGTGQIEGHRIEHFVDSTFDFDDQTCDAALLWDALQFLPQPLAEAILARVHRILAPDSPVMAFFHPENLSQTAQPQVCRIVAPGQLQLTPRSYRRSMVPFNTRAIERFFQHFRSVKFFLTRENLQEVIARR